MQEGSSSTRRRLLAAAAALPPCACAVCAAASAAEQQQRPRSGVLDRAFAAAMAEGMAEYEASVAPLKRLLFGELLEGLPATATSQEPAQLLELGVGTGPNLPCYAGFYGLGGSGGGGAGSSSTGGSASSSGSAASAAPPPPLHITGLDPNAFMRPYLEQSLQRAGWPRERLTWVEGSAEAVPLADASMDAVVCTLVGPLGGRPPCPSCFPRGASCFDWPSCRCLASSPGAGAAAQG